MAVRSETSTERTGERDPADLDLAPVVRGTPIVTVADLAAAYVRHLKGEGRSRASITGQRADLSLARCVLGPGTPLETLTPDDVARFLDHERVVLTRDGRPRSRIGVERPRRVLRQALAWAVKRGALDEAPLSRQTPE